MEQELQSNQRSISAKKHRQCAPPRGSISAEQVAVAFGGQFQTTTENLRGSLQSEYFINQLLTLRHGQTSHRHFHSRNRPGPDTQFVNAKAEQNWDQRNV